MTKTLGSMLSAAFNGKRKLGAFSFFCFSFHPPVRVHRERRVYSVALEMEQLMDFFSPLLSPLSIDHFVRRSGAGRGI